MKRNTTPILQIRFKLAFENIEKIEFLFKKEKKDYAVTLLHKVVTADDMEVQPGDTTEEFTVLLPLTAEETMKLPTGNVYMDTRVVLNGGIIPTTSVVCFNVEETLFGEVYSGG